MKVSKSSSGGGTSDLTDVSGTLAVGSGGTGATSLTDGGVLLGSGTGAISSMSVLTNGQLLIGDGSGDPTAATLTGGSGITVTNGAGSISIAADQVATAGIVDDAVTVAKIEDLARGNIIYGNASGETAKLTPGSANQVLTSDGTDISWQDASGGGATLDLNLILHTQVFGR